MSQNIEMNQELGTKWFTFYTKVRPWLTCFGTLPILLDFAQYSQVYLSNWWLLLQLAISITLPVLAIMVAIKSDGSYSEFVRFVKGVLIVETFSLAYNQGVQTYIKDFDFGSAFITFLVVLLFMYLIWYRLNIKYFKKRLIKTEKEHTSVGNTTASSAIPIEAPVPMISTTAEKDTNIATTTPKINFCRKCGEKLIEGSKFCRNCGTRIEES